MLFRPATANDGPAVAEVVGAAFGRADEAHLVESLRAEGAMLVEGVADDDASVVGHIAFSRLGVEADRPVRVAALAPLSVRPDRQRAGVGAALTRAGLQKVADAGVEAVIVLGDPGYYRRFGFSAELAKSVRSPFRGPAFMGLELRPGALSGVREVFYARSFSAVSAVNRAASGLRASPARRGSRDGS